jgi:hypothetical protein
MFERRLKTSRKEKDNENQSDIDFSLHFPEHLFLREPERSSIEFNATGNESA